MAQRRRKPAKPVKRSVSRIAEEYYDDSDNKDFRITGKQILALISAVVALVAAVPTYWTISDHWMNKQEIQRAMKDHAEHDANAQAWTAYGFAQNRVDYLDDKLAECQIRTATKGKMDPVEASICSRYESKYKTKNDEANQLKAKAVEAGKEKPIQ